MAQHSQALQPRWALSHSIIGNFGLKTPKVSLPALPALNGKHDDAPFNFSVPVYRSFWPNVAQWVETGQKKWALILAPGGGSGLHPKASRLCHSGYKA